MKPTKPATSKQIETAIEVLRAYDGEMEPDNQRDVDAVIDWLDGLLADRTIRSVARERGLTVAQVRRKMAEKGLS